MYRLLSLGDSYTIGEAVPLHDSFPYQTVHLLRGMGYSVAAPEIIAKTGWTSSELLAHLLCSNLSASYDFITLLIGVNNQYRNEDMGVYQSEFQELVTFALNKVQHHATHVFVLSIPDWSHTPFASTQSKSREAISREIDAFNAANLSIASQYGVPYIDVTSGSRRASHQASLIAKDGLHYSGLEYQSWASQLAGRIADQWDTPVQSKG